MDPAAHTQPVESLGPALEYFYLNHSWRKRWGRLLLGCLIWIIDLSLFIFELFLSANRYSQFGPAIIWKTIQIPLLVIALLFLAGGCFIRLAQMSWKMKVTLFSHGLEYQDHRGRKTWFWHEIQSYNNLEIHHFIFGIRISTHRTMILNKTGEKSLILTDDFKNIQQLIIKIREKIYPMLFIQSFNDFRLGKPLVFGPLTLRNTEGISYQKKRIPWKSLRYSLKENGYLQLSTKEKKNRILFKIQSSHIPNLDILLAIFSEVDQDRLLTA
jgi:hypothetical protein